MISASLSREQDVMLAASGRDAHKATGGAIAVLCVFHAEDTPSLYLYADGHFNCYGCGEHGTSVHFLRKVRYPHLSDAEAYIKAYADLGQTQHHNLRWSRDRDQVELWRAKARSGAPRDLTRDEKRALNTAQRAYNLALSRLPADHPAVVYAKSRGLWTLSAPLFGVGFCDGMTLGKMFQGDEFNSTGLLDNRQREWLRGRLVIPDFDRAGDCIWMTGRTVPKVAAALQQRKYINLSGCPRPLFGAGLCQQQRATEVVVVEGPLCALALRKQGVLAVALGGTYLRDNDLAFFFGPPTRDVLLCLDRPTDERSGDLIFSATERIKTQLRDVAGKVKTMHVPAPYKDPGSWLEKNSYWPPRKEDYGAEPILSKL